MKNAPSVQTSALLSDPTPDPTPDLTSIPDPPPDPSVTTICGRALVDLPDQGLKCGDYGALPLEVAQSLATAGYFDPAAVAP